MRHAFYLRQALLKKYVSNFTCDNYVRHSYLTGFLGASEDDYVKWKIPSDSASRLNTVEET